MKVYEFTKYEALPENIVKAKGYDVETIALMIDLNNPGKNSFRDTAEYEEAKETFMDVTMSCDREEALNWMRYFMVKAIAYGRELKELNWMTLFMAAYDLHNSMIRRYYNGR